MTAEIVSVGTELLLGQVVDTHAATMGRVLAECGLVCKRRSTVGDNMDRIVETLRDALSRADVVIAIGGLGPTMDDLTRDAIAKVLDDTLEPCPEMATQLRAFFESRGLRWTESILRQADRPSCGQFIPNPNGTAPGLICQKGDKRIIALPGPKGEFNPMANGPVREYLAALTGEVIHSVTIRVVGMGESHVEDLVRPLMESENPTVAPYAHTGEVSLRVTARAETKEAAETLITPVLTEIKEILGDRVFAVDAQTLEEAIIDNMTEKGLTVAVAESMTGGEIAARFTAVAGSGAVFLGGVTCYSIPAKARILGVPEDVLDRFGPVSAEVAREIAARVRESVDADFGVGITGNAGPTSDVDGKPVGLVYIGLATRDNSDVREENYRGQREDIRRRAAQAALSWLRDELMKD